MSRTERKNLLAALAVILAFALFPVASVVASSALADAAACRLDEADSHPCIIFGADWGDVLSTVFVLGWLGLVTLPLGAAALLAWLVGATALWLKGRRGGARTDALD